MTGSCGCQKHPHKIKVKYAKFDVTIIEICVCFSWAHDPYVFNISFSLATLTVFLIHTCYGNKCRG